MKRAPIARRTPLRAGTPFARGRNPDGRARETRIPAPKAQRDTGPDRKTRGLVLARDNFQCVACGRPVGGACTWWSLQHRVARGQGGSNEPWNLIAMCGSATTGCHGRCEARDREMQARGYWLESWQDPRTEAVMICGEGGGVTVWLTADGRYSLTAPGAAA